MDCSKCRHANQGTMDFQDGLVACPWLGGMRRGRSCEIRFADTGVFVFEAFDGSNGTWGGSEMRAVPAGFENRRVVRA